MHPRSELHRGLARRLALAHRALAGDDLLALVSGSTVEDLTDELSDIDLCVAFDTLPAESVLQAAGAAAGAEPWHWQAGSLDEGGLVVAFRLVGIEAQIAYTTHARLRQDLDLLLVEHTPDTPLHKLAEGLLKAEALCGPAHLEALQARLSPFPPALGRAMAVHFIGQPTPWRTIRQLVERDALLWCRELQGAACLRLLGALCGLNGRYFTTFQLKRLHRLAATLPLAPSALAERIEQVLMLPARPGFEQLHRLETEVLDLLAAAWPDLDLAPARQRLRGFP